MDRSFQHSIERARDILSREIPNWQTPDVFLQLGHGLDATGFNLENETPLTTLDGLEDTPILGTPGLSLHRFGETRVLLARGHRYLYEGHGVEPVLLPTALAAACGARDVILLESAFALRGDLRIGTWFTPTDFINRLGISPLEGRFDLIPNPFIDVNNIFNQELASGLINVLGEECMTPRLGIYEAIPGPQQPSPAEAESARQEGADVLGNGIVPEALLANALGLRVCSFLLIIGSAPSYHGRPRSYDDILDVLSFSTPPLLKALRTAFSDANESCTP